MSVELLTRRAALRPATLNVEAGTVDAVIATDTPCARAGFMETLALDPENVTLPGRAPVLDTHRQTSIRDVLGYADNIRRDGNAIIATLHISDPSALAAISRGEVTGTSIGFRVSKWAGAGRNRTAKKWELAEISCVAFPADPNARFRSETMEAEVIEQPEVTSAETTTTRAEIRTICRAVNMTAEQADALIDRGATVTEARAAAYEAITSRRPIIIGRSSEDPAVTRGLQAEALAASVTGAEPSEGARPFMDLGGSLLRHASMCLTRAGVAGVATMGADAIVARAMATTSDFPILMDDAGARVLLAGYRGAESVLKRVATQRNLPDFRDGKFLRAGGLPNLKEVPESGEIKHATILEAGEGFKLKTYAEIMSISRQAIVNDNFGVFGQWATNAGIAAANTEADLLAAMLESNPAMSDGKALFHVDHGNLAVGAVPDVDELSAARLAMRLQRGLDGKSLINATPKYLVVAADLETKAEQLLAALAAATVDDANPFTGKLTLLVEPRLAAGEWYVFADPAAVPVLAYGYLSSAPGPQLASRDGWDVLGREWRVYEDFGCGAIDWRGAYRNPGAEI